MFTIPRAMRWGACPTRRCISWPWPRPWRARFTPSWRRRSKWSRSIATTPCGPAFAARTVPKAWCSTRRAAGFRSSWRSAAARASCWPCAARTMMRTWPPPSARTRKCRSGPAISWRGASTGIPRPATWRRSPTSWNSAWIPSSWWTTIPRRCRRCGPARAEEIPEFLAHVWAFDRARVTEEDRRRGEVYVQRAERARVARSSASLEDFLASLELEVRIAPMEPAQVERVAQLTGRTNQMNATCIRRSAAEIERLSEECLTVHVTDRFGSYGLTAAMLFRVGTRALVVDTFLLSCRALGRGVEHRMVARLGEIAVERGLGTVEIPFIEAQRNRPARLFLESLGASFSGGVFR